MAKPNNPEHRRKNQLNLTVQNKDSKIDSKLKNKDLPRYSPRTHSPYIQCSKAIKSHRKQNKLKSDPRYWRQRRQKAYLRRRKNQNASYREEKTEAATLQTNTLLLSTVILPDNLVSSSHGLCKSCRHVSCKPVAGNKSSTWNTTAANIKNTVKIRGISAGAPTYKDWPWKRSQTGEEKTKRESCL